MPKNEFDFEDPLELNGIALLTSEDTTDAMCECFIEEFMRMGCTAKQVLALFRNPHYLGMNLVLEKRGEEFIRDRIDEIFARWGRPGAQGTPGSAGEQTAELPGTSASGDGLAVAQSEPTDSEGSPDSVRQTVEPQHYRGSY